VKDLEALCNCTFLRRAPRGRGTAIKPPDGGR
jgi:hypothetical protein